MTIYLPADLQTRWHEVEVRVGERINASALFREALEKALTVLEKRR